MSRLVGANERDPGRLPPLTYLTDDEPPEVVFYCPSALSASFVRELVDLEPSNRRNRDRDRPWRAC
jgi:hypothetical protein